MTSETQNRSITTASSDAIYLSRGSGWPALAEAAARTREYMLAHADAALTVEADRHWLQRKAADSA